MCVSMVVVMCVHVPIIAMWRPCCSETVRVITPVTSRLTSSNCHCHAWHAPPDLWYDEGQSMDFWTSVDCVMAPLF